MIEKIREIFKINNNSYRPYNMVICANKLHKRICHCSSQKDCEKNCCHIETCPDCKKQLKIKNAK